MTLKIKVYDDILREEGQDIFSFLLFSFLFLKTFRSSSYDKFFIKKILKNGFMPKISIRKIKI
jgi:hypothetical protein